MNRAFVSAISTVSVPNSMPTSKAREPSFELNLRRAGFSPRFDGSKRVGFDHDFKPKLIEFQTHATRET
jgi:hypothetical protein